MIGHLGSRVPIPRPTHSENGDYGTLKWNTLGDAIGDLAGNIEHTFTPLRSKSLEFIKLLKEGENWTALPQELAEKAMG